MEVYQISILGRQLIRNLKGSSKGADLLLTHAIYCIRTHQIYINNIQLGDLGWINSKGTRDLRHCIAQRDRRPNLGTPAHALRGAQQLPASFLPLALRKPIRVRA